MVMCTEHYTWHSLFYTRLRPFSDANDIRRKRRCRRYAHTPLQRKHNIPNLRLIPSVLTTIHPSVYAFHPLDTHTAFILQPYIHRVLMQSAHSFSEGWSTLRGRRHRLGCSRLSSSSHHLPQAIHTNPFNPTRLIVTVL